MVQITLHGVIVATTASCQDNALGMKGSSSTGQRACPTLAQTDTQSSTRERTCAGRTLAASGAPGSTLAGTQR